jgi:signal transduction histidine kinase
LGALSVYSTSPASGRFAESEWDKKVLTCLAHYAALALQNASRKEALRIVQQQRAAAETFAVMGDVASNLLHHVNNKVGAIPVRIQGIYAKSRETIDSNTYLAHNLRKIEECAAEALESVRENLTHLHPGELEAVDITDCVKAAIQAVNPPPNIQVQPIDLDALPMVMANHRSMTLVFSNLLENAAHVMCDGGTIIIRGQEKEHWVDIWVQDDGPGIPHAMRECIFDLNVSSCPDEHPGKLGFGLWWVKTLMTRLGGIVKLDDIVEQGATFHLRLPRAEDCS